jgi:hypothetical protein
MRFVPRNRLEFHCAVEEVDVLLEFLQNREVKVNLPELEVTFDAWCASENELDGMSFVPKTSVVTAGTPSKSICNAKFHLFNFPTFHGPDDYRLIIDEAPRQASRNCGRVLLKGGGWEVTIAATAQSYSLEKSLKAKGGFVITHMGQIVREDGSPFSKQQLEDLLGSLGYFLSFALGRWAGIALPIGFDATGNRVFEEWGMHVTTDGAWNGAYSWFDQRHGELLSQVFPGFLSLRTNPLWRQPLAHALYWYLGACGRGGSGVGINIDTGIVLAQTALELLAWTYCVLDRKVLPASAFKPRGLSAGDKLRRLTSALGIPRDIPTSLAALHARPGKKWVDGMEAITSIRNSIVHPGSGVQLPEDSEYEAWRLSLWYIDMVLLRLCGHRGRYVNRLDEPRLAGRVVPVPWP